MGYCLVGDVQRHRPQHAITATSRPSILEIEANIENLSYDVDGRLTALDFTIPITGPHALQYLQAAVSWGVAGLAEMQQRAGFAENDTAPRSIYWDLYERMMLAVEKNPNILEDAARVIPNPTIESFFTVNPTDDPTTGQRGRLTGPAIPRFEIRQEF